MMREGNYLLEMHRLFQQYVVDVYCKRETERLSFIRWQQKQFRADSYTFLCDHIMASDKEIDEEIDGAYKKWCIWKHIL